MLTIDIPDKYADKLEPVEPTDPRSDEEILATLNEYAPVTSEKNIWAFWNDGLTAMPAWCQRNAIDWVRVSGASGWTIRVLDNVPDSPNYALKYVSEANVPECFVKRTMDGPYVGQHSADFVRGATILEHGGVWMDAGSIMIRSMDRTCWDAICDPESPYKVATVHKDGQFIFNYFVAARKGDPFIQRWHELFLHLWKGRNNHDGVTADPFDIPEEQAVLDYKVGLRELMDYVSQVAAWHRLSSLEDAGDGFSGVDYWTNNMLLLDFAEEASKPVFNLSSKKKAESNLSHAERTMALLSMQRTREPGTEDGHSDEDFTEVEQAVWEALSTACFCKITHAKNLTHSKQLGSLMDEPGNAGKDRAPGSFWELLRHGSVHFRQKRETILLHEAPRPVHTLKTKLLEA
ncbi:hypothetical protein CC79DRAFT_1377210 [Sarocladium strictum]